MKLLSWLLLLLLLLLLFTLNGLPLIACMFAPAIRCCPECKYPNDLDFRFCQMFVFRRPVVAAARPLSASPDISAIDNRLEQLQGIALSSAYAKQKTSPKKKLPTFLCSLPANKTFWGHRQKADDHTQRKKKLIESDNLHDIEVPVKTRLYLY